MYERRAGGDPLLARHMEQSDNGGGYAWEPDTAVDPADEKREEVNEGRFIPPHKPNFHDD